VSDMLQLGVPDDFQLQNRQECFADRGRERRLDSLPLPPNRTGGSPASGSPVSGSPRRGLMRVQGRQREHSMHFSEHQHPFGPERWVNRWRASLLSPFGHSHCCCRHRSAPFESTFLHPFAPSPLRDFFAPMGALTPAQPGSSGRSSMNSGSFSEQVSLIHASGLLDHSVSTHLMRHCRRFLTLPFSSTASRFRSRLPPCIAGSPITPGRIEFVILRTGRSPPAAPHHASLRRSCTRFQAGERMPWRLTLVATKYVKAFCGSHSLVPWSLTLPGENPIHCYIERERPQGKPQRVRPSCDRPA
jgi:hypothetical protein